MTTFALPANGNDFGSRYTQVGPYVIRTSVQPAHRGGGYTTQTFDTRVGPVEAQEAFPSVSYLWERNVRKYHQAAVTTARRLEFLATTKVGSILLSRWGEYCQFVDFFVVVQAGPHSIKIQPCGKIEAEQSPGPRRVLPNAQEFIGKAIAKRSEKHEEGYLEAWNGEPVPERMSA